jgi:hypothetical protein
VRVRHDEGVANRIDPESCAAIREGYGEASTGECTGQPLSRERSEVPGADAVLIAEGNTSGRASASARRPGVVEDPGMCRRSLHGNREVSRPTSGNGPQWSASGRRGAVADGERVREV